MGKKKKRKYRGKGKKHIISINFFVEKSLEKKKKFHFFPLVKKNQHTLWKWTHHLEYHVIDC